jgi:WD40 repeat protein
MLWDPRDGRQLTALRGQLLTLQSVAFSPDGRRVAAGTVGLIKLWDTSSFREVCTLRGLPGTANALEFLPDGATLAAVAVGDPSWLRLLRAPLLAEIEAAEKSAEGKAP